MHDEQQGGQCGWRAESEESDQMEGERHQRAKSWRALQATVSKCGRFESHGGIVATGVAERDLGFRGGNPAAA